MVFDPKFKATINPDPAASTAPLTRTVADVSVGVWEMVTEVTMFVTLELYSNTPEPNTGDKTAPVATKLLRVDTVAVFICENKRVSEGE